MLCFGQMKNKNVITNQAQGRKLLGKELTSLVQDWEHTQEWESVSSQQEEEAQMQQWTSGELSGPQQHLFDKNSTALPLKSVAKVVFNSLHSSDKQLLKQTQDKYNIKWFVHKPPLITVFFQNMVLSPGWPSIQPLSLYLWTQKTNSVPSFLGP